jgi:hypothetical protein
VREKERDRDRRGYLHTIAPGFTQANRTEDIDQREAKAWGRVRSGGQSMQRAVTLEEKDRLQEVEVGGGGAESSRDARKINCEGDDSIARNIFLLT